MVYMTDTSQPPPLLWGKEKAGFFPTHTNRTVLCFKPNCFQGEWTPTWYTIIFFPSDSVYLQTVPNPTGWGNPVSARHQSPYISDELTASQSSRRPFLSLAGLLRQFTELRETHALTVFSKNIMKDTSALDYQVLRPMQRFSLTLNVSRSQPPSCLTSSNSLVSVELGSTHFPDVSEWSRSP